jgi:hypothetical protein
MSKYALVLGLVVWACSDDTNDVVCSDEIRPSVRLTVLDAAGAPASDAEVSYTVDGAPSRRCVSLSVSPGAYTCGIEEEGRIVISAERAGETGEARTTVRADECHVDPEDVTLTLEPAS